MSGYKAEGEAEAIPIHFLQLPGVQARVVSAFVDFAVDRLRARFAGKRASIS